MSKLLFTARTLAIECIVMPWPIGIGVLKSFQILKSVMYQDQQNSFEDLGLLVVNFIETTDDISLFRFISN